MNIQEKFSIQWPALSESDLKAIGGVEKSWSIG
jgi:hypothetical protein